MEMSLPSRSVRGLPQLHPQVRFAYSIASPFLELRISGKETVYSTNSGLEICIALTVAIHEQGTTDTR